MRETPLSVNEKDFILAALAEGQRLDGRSVDELRQVSITFGAAMGEVEVRLGKTRVLACGSCQVASPYPGRPTEGLLRFNVELSPMASPAFEVVGRPSELAVEVSRMLERTLKDSRVVDLESLCIVAEEKVWALRVDVHALDFDGNLVDAACLAALTALLHMRRPYVSVSGTAARIHSLAEHDPVGLTAHHRPVCVSFALFPPPVGSVDAALVSVVDPTRKEAAVSAGLITVAVNAHRELCGLQKFGGAALSAEQLVHFTHAAHSKAAELLAVMDAALLNDVKERAKGVWTRADVAPLGAKKITVAAENKQGVVLDATASTNLPDIDDGDDEESAPVEIVVQKSDQYGELFTGGGNAWAESSATAAVATDAPRKKSKKAKHGDLL